MTLFSPTILGDERKCKSGVTVEPELKRDIKSLSWDYLSRSSGVNKGGCKGRNVTNHVGISKLMTSGVQYRRVYTHVSQVTRTGERDLVNLLMFTQHTK